MICVSNSDMADNRMPKSDEPLFQQSSEYICQVNLNAA